MIVIYGRNRGYVETIVTTIEEEVNMLSSYFEKSKDNPRGVGDRSLDDYDRHLKDENESAIIISPMVRLTNTARPRPRPKLRK